MQFLPIILGALAAFAAGAVWYGPIFGKVWQHEVGLSDDDLKNSNMAMKYGLSFLLILMMSYALSMIIGFHPAEEMNWMHGAFHGCMAALFYSATIVGINYLYQGKSLKLWLIDAGYACLFMAVSGAVQGAMV